MLHLFSLSKGLGSAFVWLLLSASHKGQGKKKREKRKKNKPHPTKRPHNSFPQN